MKTLLLQLVNALVCAISKKEYIFLELIALNTKPTVNTVFFLKLLHTSNSVIRLLTSSSIATSSDLLPKPSFFKWNIVNRLCSFHNFPSVVSTPRKEINVTL